MKKTETIREGDSLSLRAADSVPDPTLMGRRVVGGIVLVAVLVAACGTNVGESAAVADGVASLNSRPAVRTTADSDVAPEVAVDVLERVEELPASSITQPEPVPPASRGAEVVTSVLPDSPPVVLPDSPPVVLPDSPPVVLPDSPPVVLPDSPPVVLPDSPPPAPPADLPSGQPVNILISKDEVNGIIPVYDSPDGGRLSFRDGDLWSYTFRRNRLVVRVTEGTEGDEWVEVELPVRPNGARGWVRAENFDWSVVNHHIHIDISDRSVAFYEGDNLIASTRAIVGKPATATPALRGYIVEKLPNHDQKYGSVVLGDWILMLSFFSEALDSFGGGLPRIALHGTHIPERVGEALSNGCIRIPNNIIETIARTAPLGTAVSIAV